MWISMVPNQKQYLYHYVCSKVLFWCFYFFIYINDLPRVSHVFNMLMYPDDMTLYCNLNDTKNDFFFNNELS